VTTSTFTIAGGDYEKAGWASRSLKEQLKRIGATAQTVRRAMIAAYEAEMNVVIHARNGTMVATLDNGWLAVEVRDEGPGIADIALAMTEGYSTAPSQARELGFGAGMGLPNIRRNSDRFTLESIPGVGTRVCFTIAIRPQDAPGRARNSIRIVPERCTECFRCLHVCPTRAIRVRTTRQPDRPAHATPQIFEYLCVDCTSCIDNCPAGTLTALGTTDQVHSSPDCVLVISPPFVAQFASPAQPAQVLAALRALGFGEVRTTELAEQALRAAVVQHAMAPGRSLPVLSPVCPAVLNLVATRFPSLLDNVAPFLSPLESVREELSGRRAAFVALCPAEQTAIQSGRGPAHADILLPATVSATIRAKLSSQPRPDRPEAEPAFVATPDPNVLRVTGMRHVINVLEMIENGLVREPAVLELFACDEGCFGSPLLKEDAYVSRRRWQQSVRKSCAGTGEPSLAQAPDHRSGALPRTTPLAPRPGMRLDQDMGRAIARLAEIEAVRATLPGKDCGLCGCPTCQTLAEDIVLGRATRQECAHLKKGARD
jgi:anti-sigma regulatory factor (Ser/Thr protein kinase)/Pyruvate/2-oxoacid:ferredoxin oxidoreductase delta subunit